jgi:hypothetical protein
MMMTLAALNAINPPNRLDVPFRQVKHTPLVFLDIDGVVNCDSIAVKFTAPSGIVIPGIDPLLVAKVNRIVDAVPDVLFILSSTWRQWYQPTIDYLIAQGFRGTIVGHTTRSRYRHDDSDLLPLSTNDVMDRPARGAQILDFIDCFFYKGSYVALDDDDDCGVLGSRWIQTDADHGITDSDIDRAIQTLLGNAV